MISRTVNPLADIVRWGVSLALLAASALLCRVVFWPADPGSTPIQLTGTTHYPSASPAAVRAATPGARIVRLAFVGDIMQHHAQASDDFDASYATIARMLAPYNAVVGNMEFPVDSARPVGPPRGSTTFNGSREHLGALARAGFDALSVANNHAFDQGAQGLAHTLLAMRTRGVAPIGVASQGGAQQPAVLLERNGVRVALLGYTIPPNQYRESADTMQWVPRSAPLTMLNFRGWEAEFRDTGRELLQQQASAARAAGADVVIAVVHWGEEWQMQPNANQQRAAHDMIDAGFDLVVGSHPHVLQAAELYRDRLIAYSLGNFNSDFPRLETRTGAILDVDFSADSGGVRLSRFAFQPVTVQRSGHVVVPADTGSAEWRHACRMLGDAVRGCSATGAR